MQTAPPSSEPNFGNATHPLHASEILIMFKTGATSLWHRVPMHLSTTLSNDTLTPHIAFYSDAPDTVLTHPVHDTLANLSDALKATPDFALYHRIRDMRTANLYLENTGMEGDAYLPGGWRLDKYKFLPMAAHAAANYPHAKWYVYLEDDNFYFWPTLYAWLATFDPNEPIVLGSPAVLLGEDFAHGGAGFAISRGGMRETFGKDAGVVQRWEDYARERCCGDQVLSHVMQEMGVSRYRELDGTGWMGLQSSPDWRIGFGAWNWCSPLMNVHKVHQADLARLHIFGKTFLEELVSGSLSFAS
jgi:hypothetical protein